MLKKVLKFCFRCANEPNSISHRLPFALRNKNTLNGITHCPFPSPFLPARRYRPVCLLHLDSSRARLWTMDSDLGHLLLLHWGLHSARCLGYGSVNEFPRLLLRFNGTWCGTPYRKYHRNEKLKMAFMFSDQYHWEFFHYFLCEKYSQLLVTGEKKNY